MTTPSVQAAGASRDPEARSYSATRRKLAIKDRENKGPFAGWRFRSLLYLAAQVRQSNRLARTQARQSWIQMTQGELHEMADQPSIFDAFVDDMLAEAPLTDHFNSMDAW